MLAWAHAPTDPERCRRQPLPEEETEADDDAGGAAHVQPCARPSAQGLTPRRLAALAAALAGAVAVGAWGRARGVRAAPPLPPRWREGAVGLLQKECTEVNENCLASRCCTDPALTCFEKDDTWASCIEGCEPGVHEDWDLPGQQTPWSCRPLSDLGTAVEAEAEAEAEAETEAPAVEAEAVEAEVEAEAVEAEAEATGPCEDLLDDWQDAAGRSCRDYERGRLCSASGDFGPGWNSSGGLPVPGVALLGRGLSAAEACCACGGGAVNDGTWSLVHRDWRCKEGASMLADKQAPDKLRLPDCQRFCLSYHHVEFWTSRQAGVCQCHRECSTDGQATNPGYNNLVYRREASV